MKGGKKIEGSTEKESERNKRNEGGNGIIGKKRMKGKKE